MNEKPIGVFDSGVGGISTLKKLNQLMPNEDFIFYGDSLHAPYGNKTQAEVFNLSKSAVEFLLEKGVKAIVIACNTATSAAKDMLIEDYPQLPIVGIEPSLKEAIDDSDKNILVIGTKLTINLPKYKKMLNKYIENHTLYSVACPGLAEYVEGGMTNPEQLDNLLENFFRIFKNKEIDSIVLGCTHYPFVKTEIKRFFSKDVCIHDGYEGVSRQLKNLLVQAGIVNAGNKKGKVTFYSSKSKGQDYYHQLFESYE